MYNHMTSMYGDMFAVYVFTLICLMSWSHAAPLACEDLTQPLDKLDPRDFEGNWALVADSVVLNQSDSFFIQSNSTSIDFYNSTLIRAQRFGESCIYFVRHISIEGSQFNIKFGQMYYFSGTFYKTTCADCVVLRFKWNFPRYKSEELCLFSKRREVDQKELREFAAQVECLKMPKLL